MKKLLAAMLSLSMCLALCACETVEQLKNVELPALPELPAATEPAGEDTEQNVTETEAHLELAVEELSNYVTVSTKKTVKQFYDPEKGEKLILTFAYDTPKVMIDGRDEAADKINEYLGMLDETYYTGNDYGAGTSYGIDLLHELAIDKYTYIYNTGSKENNFELVSSRESAVARCDNRVFSILFNDYVYISAEEESHDYKAYSFDTETGERISLEMLGAGFENSVRAYVKTMYNEDFIFSDDNWFFTYNGVSVLSEDGGAEPEAFTVPYSEVFESIDAKYLPTERKGNGKLELMLQSDYTDGSLEIVDLVTLSEQGDALMLTVSGTVYDVTVYSVGYNNASGSFQPTATHWLCSYMQDSAVQLICSVPEGMPNVMISYRTQNGEITNKLITQSGVDGSFILAGTDIEAVG